MIASPAGALLAEQLALIREIGRNLLGEVQRPGGSDFRAAPQMVPPPSQTDPGADVSLPRPADMARADHPVERWRDEGPILMLAGLRQPFAALHGRGWLASAGVLASAATHGEVQQSSKAAGTVCHQAGAAATGSGPSKTGNVADAAAAGADNDRSTAGGRNDQGTAGGREGPARPGPIMGQEFSIAARPAGIGLASAAPRPAPAHGPDSAAAAFHDGAKATMPGFPTDRTAASHGRADVNAHAAGPSGIYAAHSETSRMGEVGGIIGGTGIVATEGAEGTSGAARIAGGALPEHGAMIERSLAALGLAGTGVMAAPGPGPLPERAGIVASFILNAHFTPGWPPPRPYQSVQPKAATNEAQRLSHLTDDEMDGLVYLANMGFNREQMARAMKLLERSTRRSGLLDAIAQFFTNLGMMMSTIQQELELIIDEASIDWRARHGALAGRRARIDLR